jgi:Superinfection immunity protein
MEAALLFILLILLASYFLPTIIALCRGHGNTLAIFLLNLFLGWTLVAWVGALVWACYNPPQQIVVMAAPVAPPPSPFR